MWDVLVVLIGPCDPMVCPIHASLSSSFIVFIMPAGFYLRIHGAAATWAMWAACGFVVVFGVLGGVAGVVSNAALAARHQD